MKSTEVFFYHDYSNQVRSMYASTVNSHFNSILRVLSDKIASFSSIFSRKVQYGILDVNWVKSTRSNNFLQF